MKKIYGENIKSEKNDLIGDYQQLIEYNKSILHMMSTIHCNSSIAQDVYKQFEPELYYKVIPITHGNLPLKRKYLYDGAFKMAYLGGISKEKGFETLINATQYLASLDFNKWELYLFGDDFTEYMDKDNRIKNGGKYNYEEMGTALQDITVVIVSSNCYETFGYIVLEALSIGIPVIVSDRVGSWDIISDAPIDLRCKADDPKSLAMKIVEVYQKINLLLEWAEQFEPCNINHHCNEIRMMYEETLH